MWRPGSSGAAIDFTAVPDLDHFNGAACVVDSMNDSELALANGIASLAGLPPVGRGSEAILLLTKRFDLLSSRRLNE